MIFPAAKISVNAYGLSDVGRLRKTNQDSFLFTELSSDSNNSSSPDLAVYDSSWIFMVADGMGGEQAGDVASQMTVDLVAKNFAESLNSTRHADQHSFRKVLTHAVEKTNQTVFQASQSKNELRGMGTTLTAAIVIGNAMTVAQLGDSRAYLLRGNTITQLTKDQSLVAQMVVAGKITPQEAKTHPRRNVILQALGVQSRVDVSIVTTNLQRNDCLVLCSDGLWGKVDPEEIIEFVNQFEPQAACEKLVQLANDRGGEDNITVIVANFSGDGLPHSFEDNVHPLELPKRNRPWWRFWHKES